MSGGEEKNMDELIKVTVPDHVWDDFSERGLSHPESEMREGEFFGPMPEPVVKGSSVKLVLTKVQAEELLSDTDYQLECFTDMLPKHRSLYRRTFRRLRKALGLPKVRPPSNR